MNNKIKSMSDELLLDMHQELSDEIRRRIQKGTSFERIKSYLIMKNGKNITSTEISDTLNMPQSTVRQILRTKIKKEKSFVVHVDRKPLQVSYKGDIIN